MYNAYSAIFNRIGLEFRAVEADSGAIGGAVSKEFQVLAESGEDLIVYSDKSDYAANIEQATSLLPEIISHIPSDEIQKTSTPDVKTIQQVSEFFGKKPEHLVKTLLVVGKDHPCVAIVLRGNDELNPIKAAKHPLIKSPLEFVTEDDILKTLNIPVGFIGPMNLPIPIIVDHHARALSSFICGANEKDYHYINVNWERDVTYTDVADLRTVNPYDPSPDGKGVLHIRRGIEVGHIFQLGNKYSKAMQANVVDENGHSAPIVMGTYGIGVSRIVAATIEQFNDEKGMLWPINIAPFQLVIIPINAAKSEEVKKVTEQLYNECITAGIDVLLDDRQERPGVLFAENDLIGIPHRIVISASLLEQGMVEYKARNADLPQNQPLNNIIETIRTLLNV